MLLGQQEPRFIPGLPGSAGGAKQANRSQGFHLRKSSHIPLEDIRLNESAAVQEIRTCDETIVQVGVRKNLTGLFLLTAYLGSH